MPPTASFDDATSPRLATVVGDGEERIAVALRGRVLDLTAALPDAPRRMVDLIAAWDAWRAPIADLDERAPALAIEAFAPPVRPEKILCVGANYHDHVAEMAGPAGITVTDDPFPFGFLKPASALAASGATVTLPAYAQRVDWEAELALVIGDGRLARGPRPLDAVFGYTILNDLSVRDFLPFPHALGLDAVVAKGWDGAAPLGPWITPAEGVPDPSDLPVRLLVNGDVMQDSSTAQLIFGLKDLVAHYGRVLTLSSGDVIATGTPAGVGAGQRPPRFLADGDLIEITIGDLGTLRTPVAAGPGGPTSLTIQRPSEATT